MNKKLISIFLLSLWLLQWSLPSLVHSIGSWIYQKQSNKLVKNRTKETKTTQIYIGLNEKINWVKYGKEFRKEGLLYDIISIIKSKKGLLINCHQDIKEQQFIANYYEVIKKQQNRNSPYNKFFKKIMDQKYLLDNLVLISEIEVINTSEYFGLFTIPINYHQKLRYPPPELA